jgi:8-oxo-dGTP pyrophosphatase MutT (NUDIX family)
MPTEHSPYGGTPQALRSSVNAVVFNEQGQILLQQRRDNGYWNLPGGHIELGESATTALVREVHEETGLVVEYVRLVGVYSAPELTTMRYPNGDSVQFVVVVAVCRVVSGELSPNDEALAVAWHDPHQLPSPFSPNHLPRVRDACCEQPAVLR